MEALAERGARVTVLARDSDALAAVGKELGAETIAADAPDPGVAASLLGRLRPQITILSAGSVPEMAHCARMAGSVADGEDAVQDAIERAYAARQVAEET